MTRSIWETQRVRYLLGLCSLAEREHIESEYFENQDAFQQMLSAEDDLIDAYARGELAGEERRSFEKIFVSSLRGKDRVQFARAFADAVSATRPLETKTLANNLLDIFKISQSPGLLRTATIVAVIVFIAVLGWLALDRKRITNELRELRSESMELSKRTEALQRSNETDRTRTAEIAAQLTDLRAQPDKPRHRERDRTVTQKVHHLPEVKNDREKFAIIVPKHEEPVINTDVATLGNTFESRRITELPLNASNVVNLLSLQPGNGYVANGRADQANITLDGLSVGQPFNTFSLLPRNTISGGETIIHIARYFSWIRFQLTLETAALHEDYSVTIKTRDGRAVTTLNWIEPLTPNQTILDTPAISASDLHSGDYVLLLMGQEPDGSFVKVDEYSFKVIRY